MTSPFVIALAAAFGESLRKRGLQYFHLGRVERIDVAERVASAHVRGSSLYVVRIVDYRDAPRCKMHCTCPFGARAYPCAHMWATVLAIDAVERGTIDAPLRLQGPLRVGEAEANAASAAAQPPTLRPSPPPPPPPPPPAPPKWLSRVARLLPAAPTAPSTATLPPLVEYRLHFGRHDAAALSIQTFVRLPRKHGAYGEPRQLRLSDEQRAQLPAVDRSLLALRARDFVARFDLLPSRMGELARDLALMWPVSAQLLPETLELLSSMDRVFVADAKGARPLRVDATAPFEFELVVADDKPGVAVVTGRFRRGDEVFALPDVAAIAMGVAFVARDRLVRLECADAAELAQELARGGPLELPSAELPALLGRLALLAGAPRFLANLLDRFAVVAPIPVVAVRIPKLPGAALHAGMRFDYDGELLAADDARPVLAVGAGIVRRDFAAEAAARQALVAIEPAFAGPLVELPRARLAAFTAACVAAGCRVLVDGRTVRPFAAASARVGSGIDWFELSGQVAFDGRTAGLPELLRRRVLQAGMVELDDGTFGLLPEQWLRRIEALRLLDAEVDGDVLRVPRSRGLVLDALLAARSDDAVEVDAAFAALRARLGAFEQVQSRAAPAAFVGSLRPYQCEGLGWLHFLRDFGLGGCLADDMGLGKTVQVLALLAHEHAAATSAAAVPSAVQPAGPRRQRGRAGTAALAAAASGARSAARAPGAAPMAPSLLVAPRSVIGNWHAETQRFAPGLRVVDFSGHDRWSDANVARLAQADLVLTTYALVRSDVVRFAERGQRFHYAILDEAQAIKNPDSQGAKAVRLLQAAHRLVLTGTPVENHLGDLWSLFEFLNPGMLGRLPAFRALFGAEADDAALAAHRQLVQRALRPVLLRRTKAQVLTDLPDKVEQTLWCVLGPAQRKRYDQLVRHFRAKLLGELGDGDELDDRQRFVVLEALLRLRQAACHEALLDPRAAAPGSAKFDELLPRLEELAVEGHKALVFSQFTSLLDLLEPELRTRGIAFERIDGSVKRRAERVRRFQEDPDCRVFLISLKAGGVGLNLTAASYVFLLDPWWNPAVELQAIDRAHRIGQKRVVNAYRLVCRDTVEERVLELQSRKKALCEAILGNERSLLQDLTRADLELLLG